ncbi:MAG: hypothetical protein IOC90_02530 [Methylocystis sp.]|nr:hypothetical protein [Methylocystis sp.]MCA3584971.1 hypothetical protein [Methylocystis sp.]MCA3586901.1 hypothetical protein [Methylocystis sp.]MCA3592189.1 hypothetical protein [Methylocystis sp.]
MTAIKTAPQGAFILILHERPEFLMPAPRAAGINAAHVPVDGGQRRPSIR